MVWYLNGIARDGSRRFGTVLAHNRTVRCDVASGQPPFELPPVSCLMVCLLVCLPAYLVACLLARLPACILAFLLVCIGDARGA